MSNAAAVINAASSHFHAGRKPAAEQTLRRALARHHSDPDVNHLLALVLVHLDKSVEAEFFARRAIAIMPDISEYHNTLGQSLSRTGRRAEAVESFRAAARLRPDWAGPWNNLAIELVSLKRLSEAAEAYQHALAIEPSMPDAVEGYGAMYLDAGRADVDLAMIRDAISRTPDPELGRIKHEAVAASYALDDPDAIRYSHERTCSKLQKLTTRRHSHPASDDPDRPLRVAFVSPDFRTHSVSSFFEPLLRNLDRERFTPVCYHAWRISDKVTDRLRALCPDWRDASTWSDLALSDRIREDRIDIAIEMAGHMDNNRLAAFIDRPAPVQCHYLGYACTLGARFIDYRIVDGITDPPGADTHATERLARMSGCFLCYQPAPEAAFVTPAPTNTEKPITFGSFNSARKLSPATARAWGRIIAAVPNSRLIVKFNWAGDDWSRSQLMGLFRENGLDPSRVEIRPFTGERVSHMEAYKEIDIALDTFPYTGTTTTCEALWMGVPVMTRYGVCHHSRVSLSILTSVGLTDLACAGEDEHVSAAVALASDRDALARARDGLRERLLSSPVCDGKGHAARFADLLRDLWRRRCGSGF